MLTAEMVNTIKTHRVRRMTAREWLYTVFKTHEEYEMARGLNPDHAGSDDKHRIGYLCAHNEYASVCRSTNEEWGDVAKGKLRKLIENVVGGALGVGVMAFIVLGPIVFVLQIVGPIILGLLLYIVGPLVLWLLSVAWTLRFFILGGIIGVWLIKK